MSQRKCRNNNCRNLTTRQNGICMQCHRLILSNKRHNYTINKWQTDRRIDSEPKQNNRRALDDMSHQELIAVMDRDFQLMIRLRDTNTQKFMQCPLCGRVCYMGTTNKRKQVHAMHWITRNHYLYRWDEDNVHGGCGDCNSFCDGNYNAYNIWMYAKYGADKCDKMKLLGRLNKGKKPSRFEVIEQIKLVRANNKILRKQKI